MPYKLEWLATLKRDGQQWLADDPDKQVALWATGTSRRRTTTCGPWRTTSTRATSRPDERAAFQGFLDAGFVDVVRPHAPGTGRLHLLGLHSSCASAKRRGMRIDFVLGSPALAGGCAGAAIDREERKGKGASDHAPVVVELED